LIITTKPGVVSEPKFSVDYYEGFSRLTQRPEMADAYQYMAAANEAAINSSGTPRYTEDYINATQKANGLIPNDNPQMFNPYLYPNVNWMDEMFNDMGNNRRVNLNLRGGAPKATYYASLSYYDEKGLTKSDPSQAYNSEITYNRYNFLTNINLKVLEKTTLDVGVNGYFATGNYPEISTSDLFRKSMTVSPVMMPKLYPDGSIPGVNKENEDMSNPYAELTRRGYKDEYNTQVNSNIKLVQNLDFWSWSKGLKAHAMIAFDVKDKQVLHYKIRESSWKPNGTKSDTGLWNEDVYDENGILKLVEEYQGNNTLSYEMKANAGDGEGSRDILSWRTFYAEAAINYNRTFNSLHNVTGLFLFNMKDYRNPNTNTLFNSLAYKDMGFSGRATYSYNDRYFAEVNLGYTGSQNFSPERRFGFFPAFALGWVLSNESFWQPLSPYISFLKLRYSDGYVGSDSLGGDRFGFTTEMEDTDHGYSFGGKSEGGVQVKRYGALVMWSRIHARNLGLDVNFFGDKLNFVFDAFKEKRDKIYTQRMSIPDYAGFSNLPNGNVGVVENRGFEASFEYNQAIGRDWFISLRGNFTYNEDEIIDNDEPEPAYPWLSTKGRNVLAREGYIAEGLFSSEEEIVERNIRQFGEDYPGAITRPGDIKYKDLNGDGAIDANDKTQIGHGDVPKYYYGFGGDFRYKNVSLGILFQGTSGADRHLEGRSIHPFQGDGGLGNLFANIDDRWSPDDPTNQNVFYPRLAWGGGDAGNVNNFVTSTWWQRDVSFLRLKQFTVSYYFPQKWMDKTFMERGRLYVMGANVFTWSNFKLWDPELNTNNGSSYPNVTTFSVGVNFSF
jgi:TonB-linked SusC/RagA family outer membrane protein